MKTLIELYDEKPIKNVLAVDVFKPQNVVYLCPTEIAQNKDIQKSINTYFKKRNLNLKTFFYESSKYNAQKICRLLEKITSEFDDCAIDISGGTDDALFACGNFCFGKNIPVFTYSRKTNSFYEINNSPFANNLKCQIKYSIEDIFAMAGGQLRQGRTDNSSLSRYYDLIDNFCEFFFNHKKEWKKIIGYIQRASNNNSLHVDSPYFVKSEHAGKLAANEGALNELQQIGCINNLTIESGSRVSFDFLDENIRFWLRDIGCVLELLVYKKCKLSGIFNDVLTSAVVSWDGQITDSVINELDVVAIKDIFPVFISCKVCQIDTDALNELAILRDRFGGKMSQAIIVSTETCRAVTRHRANDLNIQIIDINDLRCGLLDIKLENLRNNN